LKNPLLEIDSNPILIRPSWDDYFFGLAFLISQRSSDWSTKHAAIAVDKNHKVIGFGYNGLVRGVDDGQVPRDRNEKNRWMIHSEVNLILNSYRSFNDTDSIYITGIPCLQCTSNLIQHGAKKIIMADRRGYSNPPLTQLKDIKKLCKKCKINLKTVKPNLNWLYEEKLKRELTDLCFITK